MKKERRPLRTQINSKSLTLMGVPKRFHPLTIKSFKTFNNDQLKKVQSFVSDYIDNLYDNMDNCKGIIFYGANGTGKTMLSCIILKEAYRKRYNCRRITFADYINKCTNSWNVSSALDDEDDIFYAYKNAEFLVLEEIGKEIESKIAIPMLEDLLRYREDNMLTTVICTNLNLSDIKEFYGNSIFSLMQGNLTPVEMNFGDARLEEYRKRGK